ncbi:MAG: discoidin domain-containing protein [Bacteroidota bacterium]
MLLQNTFKIILSIFILFSLHGCAGEKEKENSLNKVSASRQEPSLPGEIARFNPPVGLPDGEPPFIYAVSARPMGIVTFPQYAVDNDLHTRWSSRDKDQWLTFHISHRVKVDQLDILFATEGEIRFHIETSADGLQWKRVYDGANSVPAGRMATYHLQPTEARYVRITPHRESNWREQYNKSILEVKIGSLKYRPSSQMQLWSKSWISGVPVDEYLANHKPVPRGSYNEVAVQSITTLIEYGTDRYGKVHSPIWVQNLDLETLDCFPRYNDDLERSASSRQAPYGTGHRAIRPGQRPAGASNLYFDQPMIRAVELHDLLSGKELFLPAVENYVNSYCQSFINEKTGLLDWGVHLSRNVYSEELQHDGYANATLHELNVILPLWPTLYRMEPGIFSSEMEQFWYLHTDEKTGEVDRHDHLEEKGHGLAFAMTAGEIALACAYQHTLNPDGPWLDRALQVASYHWDRRNKTTNLFANVPDENGKRFDNFYSDTTIPGLWASRVLMAGLLTDNKELIDMARKTLLAWAHYGWDEQSRMPWSALALDGLPIDGTRDYEGVTYDKFQPVGHWDLWKDYYFGFEAPFNTLLTYAMAAYKLNDPQLKEHTVRLAEYYHRHLPANGKYGTMAVNYGKLISFYLVMEQLTGNVGYRETAERVADEALDHLWSGKLILGFAGRMHYSAVEGQGYLVQALLELDATPEKMNRLRDKNLFLWNF